MDRALLQLALTPAARDSCNYSPSATLDQDMHLFCSSERRIFSAEEKEIVGESKVQIRSGESRATRHIFIAIYMAFLFI